MVEKVYSACNLQAFTDIMAKIVLDLRKHFRAYTEIKITYSKTDASIQDPKTWISEEPYFKNYVRIDRPTIWIDAMLFPEGVKFRPNQLISNPDLFFINDTSCQPKDVLASLKQQFYTFKVVSNNHHSTKSVFIMNLGVEKKPLYCVIRGFLDTPPETLNLYVKTLKTAVSCDLQKMGLK